MAAAWAGFPPGSQISRASKLIGVTVTNLPLTLSPQWWQLFQNME
jgi:hypothetical protein